MTHTASRVSKPQKLGANCVFFWRRTRIFKGFCDTPMGLQTAVLAKARAGDLFPGLPLGPQGLALSSLPRPLPLLVSGCADSLPLTSPTAAHEAKVVESGHLVLHDCRGITQLRRVILIIASHHCHHRSIRHIPQCHHLRAQGQGDNLESREGQEEVGRGWAAPLGPRRTAGFLKGRAEAKTQRAPSPPR